MYGYMSVYACVCVRVRKATGSYECIELRKCLVHLDVGNYQQAHITHIHTHTHSPLVKDLSPKADLPIRIDTQTLLSPTHAALPQGTVGLKRLGAQSDPISVRPLSWLMLPPNDPCVGARVLCVSVCVYVYVCVYVCVCVCVCVYVCVCSSTSDVYI